MRASGGADDYVQLRRYAVWVLESLDRALGSSLFEPAEEPTQHEPEHDPGSVLVELLSEVGDALSGYADRVAAEERLRTRRYAVAAAATLLVAFAWWRRRRC
jgi:hypothetical protein